MCLLLVGVGLLYWPGLAGPYLFDDFWNLSPIEKWSSGEIGWRQALLPNASSVVASRPVGMASFMLTTWIGGIGTFPSKLGNLILHLACGWLVWRLARRLVVVDDRLAPHADRVALAIAAVWLLHPLHVSTVLYAIQRMSQWSALAMLAAVLAYLSARRSLERGRLFAAVAKLFVFFPALVVTGLLGKQNAVIAPALCLVVELSLSREPLPLSARRLRAVFFLSALALPAVAVIAYLGLHPGALLDGYQDWDFTWQQRVLTQPRVLFDYIGAILVPYSPGMGLYTDDFSHSVGLLQPPNTLIAIVGLGAITALAVWQRRKFPLAFMGWLFFLVAHAVEASPLPLEMHYEHRNYLPSFGLLLAVAGLLAPVFTMRPRNKRAPAGMLGIAACALALVLAVATFGRVLVWQSFDTIVAQGVAQHPRSMRAASDAAWLATERGQYDEARSRMQALVEAGDQRARVFGHLQLAAIECYSGEPLDSRHLQRAVAEALPKATVYEAQVIKIFDNATLFGQCQGKAHVFAEAAQRILDAATTQPEENRNKYVPREIVARLYARGGDWRNAQAQAELAWHGGHNPPTGALLAQIYIRNGALAQAKALIDELDRVIPGTDAGGRAALLDLRRRLATAAAPGVR